MQAYKGAGGKAGGVVGLIQGGSRSSNTACPTHAFFRSGE